jgi:chromosome segregation ATPase
VAFDERLASINENLARTAALQAQHAQDIAQIDTIVESLSNSVNRHDERLERIESILSDLVDKQSITEERFVELASIQKQSERRLARLEGNFELFIEFVKDFREESKDFFRLSDRQFASLAKAQERTDAQIAALVGGQARTDERVKALESNGHAKPAKKASKKTAAKAKSGKGKR